MRNDIAFYIKMFPLVSIHPEAYEKSKAIICAGDNEKALALLEDAYAKREIPKSECVTQIVDEHIRLGRSLGISGTPAIVFEDGKLVSGALKIEDLIKNATGEVAAAPSVAPRGKAVQAVQEEEKGK